MSDGSSDIIQQPLTPTVYDLKIVSPCGSVCSLRSTPVEEAPGNLSAILNNVVGFANYSNYTFQYKGKLDWVCEESVEMR